MQCWLFVCTSLFAVCIAEGDNFKMLFFDDPDVCQTKGNVYWLKQHISLIIIGRGSSHRHLYEDCSIVLGTISMKSLLMQFSFEACYIGDCGVVLELNQSDTSNFSPASSVMARITCNHGAVGTVQSMGHHYARIHLHKDDLNLLQYNFRINVTLIDPFNQSALKMYKLVLVAMVTACVVGMAFWFLTKYLVARKSAYLELCRERSMERALRLYNHRGNVSTAADYDTSFFEHSALPGDQRQISEDVQNSRRRHGEIMFVSCDGNLQRFRLLDQPNIKVDNGGGNGATTTIPVSQSPTEASSGSDRGINVMTSVVAEDYLPSYDEAIQMPEVIDGQTVIPDTVSQDVVVTPA